MNKHSNNSNKIIPSFLLFLYPALVGLDILLTYLATPNLQHEANPLIKSLNFGFVEIVVGAVLFVLVVIIIITKTNHSLASQLKDYKQSKFKLKTSVTVMDYIIFASHFLASLWIIPNNLISYLYLTGNKNKQIINYIELTEPLASPSNMLIMYGLFVILGISFFTLRIKHLHKQCS